MVRVSKAAIEAARSETDREADAETRWRVLTAPNCMQAVFAAARRYVLAFLPLASSINVRAIEYGATLRHTVERNTECSA